MLANLIKKYVLIPVAEAMYGKHYHIIDLMEQYKQARLDELDAEIDAMIDGKACPLTPHRNLRDYVIKACEGIENGLN
jgi:hypothetical protein